MISQTPTRRFQDVGVWQKAHAWMLSSYHLTESFPRHEIYGLTSQLRRAAVSIPANFAEGYKKVSRADKARFLNMAQGSLEECRYYLILANDLGYAETTEANNGLEEVSRMLNAYHRKLLTPDS